MDTTFVAHVITAEADLASGHPEIIIMIHDSETGEAIPVASYPLSNEDTLQSALDTLREHDWRVLDHPSQVYTCVDVGYDVVTVEPNLDFTIDGMEPEEWFYAMTMD